MAGNGLESVKVYNAMGQLVFAENYGDTEQMEIDLSAFSAGVYMITVQSRDGQVMNKTLVKQ